MTEATVVTPAIIRAVLAPSESNSVDWIAQRLSMELYHKVRTIMVHDSKATVTLVVSTRGTLQRKEDRLRIAEIFRQAGWIEPVVHLSRSPHGEEDEISLVVQSAPL